MCELCWSGSLDGNVTGPAKSTIHAVLDRHGLVRWGGGPRHRAVFRI
jgi:hypothetical protein